MLSLSLSTALQLVYATQASILKPTVVPLLLVKDTATFLVVGARFLSNKKGKWQGTEHKCPSLSFCLHLFFEQLKQKIFEYVLTITVPRWHWCGSDSTIDPTEEGNTFCFFTDGFRACFTKGSTLQRLPFVGLSDLYVS